MNITSFPRIAVLSLALGTAALTATFAQAQTTDDTDSTPNPSSSKHFRHHDAVLTADERAELKKDFQDALAANAQLKTDMDNLKAQEKALHEKQIALHKQIHSAIVAEDPNAQAIFDKLAAAHKGQGHGDWHHHHHDGGDTSTDTSTDTSN